MSIGMHVSKAGRYETKKARTMPQALREDMAFMEGWDIGKPSAQIFVSGPQSYKQTLTADDKEQIRRYVQETDLRLVIHGAYVDAPWCKKLVGIHNIMTEMRIAYQIGATGVVVHLGAGAYDDGVLEFVFTELEKLEPDVRAGTILWLEINSAKKSAGTYETPVKLIRLFERVRKVTTLNVGLCIDTAHVFACGYALDSYEAAKQWFETLTRGINVPIMIHLNDSSTPLGSGKDVHESLCYGEIWSAYHPETGVLPIAQSGLAYIVSWIRTNNIVAILERDEDKLINDMQVLQNL